MKVVYFHMDMMQSYKWKHKIDLKELDQQLIKKVKWFEFPMNEKGESATINLDKCWAIEYKEEIPEEGVK